MNVHAFIFSNEPRQRIARHLSFWALFTVHFFIQNLMIGTANEAVHPRTPLEALRNIAYFVPIYLVSVYAFIYFAVPRFLFKHRYAAFAVATAALLVFTFIACSYAGVLYEHVEWKIPYREITFADNKYHAVVNGGFVSVMILGIAGGFRFAKQWVQKKRESEAVMHQTLAAELQLLKIQINPRFLFHSLNTVKQNILAGSSRAPQLLLQVADLLSYILYESDRDYIPLQKELAMIEEYLSLEENSEQVNGPVVMNVAGEVDGKEITPLVSLSVVETAFEWLLEATGIFSVRLNIEIVTDGVEFALRATSNATLPEEAGQKFSGIKKQLDGLYGGRYRFCIESGAKQAAVYLQLPLCATRPVSDKQLVAVPAHEDE